MHLQTNQQNFKGFFVSTFSPSWEKFAVRDAYRLLKQQLEIQYPEISEQQEIDIEKIINEEQDQLNEKPKKQAQIFQQIKTKAKGVIFIKFNQPKEIQTEINLEEFIRPLMDSVWVDNKQITKDISRMIPVQIACHSSVENFEKNLKEISNQFFNEESKNLTWSFEYKCRNNNKFTKQQFNEVVSQVIPLEFKRIDYNGDLTVWLDISHNIMSLSILRDFNKYRKFQLIKKQSESPCT